MAPVAAEVPGIPEIVALLSHWAIAPLAVTAHASVLRVEAEEGLFCLKPVHKAQDRLQFMLAVQEHLLGNGFESFCPLCPACDGSPAVWRDRVAWTLAPWAEGRALEYSDTTEIAAAAQVLAGFHVATGGFRPAPRLKPPPGPGKWAARFAARHADLVAAASLEGRPAELRRLAARAAEHATRSLDLLRGSAYAALCRRPLGGPLPVCHGDPAARNLVREPDGGIRLLDLYSLGVDLPATDLWRLLRRMGQHGGWSVGALREVVRAYAEVRPLGAEEKGVLQALLWFPEEEWRLFEGSAGPARAAGHLASAAAARLALASLEARERCLAQWAGHGPGGSI